MDDNVSIKILLEDKLPYRGSSLGESNYKTWGTPDSLITRVICAQSVIELIEEHARSDQREVGGWLLGQAYRDKGAIFIEIINYLPAQNLKSDQSSVTHFNFSADVQAEMWKVKDKEYADDKIVGWFHSHPGHGVFLSQQDINLHTKEFPRTWHTALVFDPIRHEGGFFVWQDTDLQQSDGFYELFDDDRSEAIVTWQNYLAKDKNLQSQKHSTVIDNDALWKSWENPYRKLSIFLTLALIFSWLLGAFLFFYQENRLNSNRNDFASIQLVTVENDLKNAENQRDVYRDKLLKANETLVGIQTIVATLQVRETQTPAPIQTETLDASIPVESLMPTYPTDK